MTTNGTAAAPVPPVRRLDVPGVQPLAQLVEEFEDLQTTLRCCERLVAELATPGGPDGVVVEAVWTLALLCYARCFSTGKGDVALTEQDVTATHSSPEAVEWHRLLLQLRDHHCDPVVNPRETFSVGVTQGPDGAPSGVAITSARQPLVDDLTVRQTGAIAYALSALVNERIESRQAEVFEQATALPRDTLDQLAPLDVAEPGPLS